MKASAWKDGSGTCYGIRVGKPNVLRYFTKENRTIQVEIDGQFHDFPLSDAFWNQCPEFRGPFIRQWLQQNGLAVWPKGRPPRFELTPLGENRYRLSRLPDEVSAQNFLPI